MKVETGCIKPIRRPYKHNYKVALELIESLRDGKSKRVSFSRTSNQRRLTPSKMIEFGVLIVVSAWRLSPTVILNTDPLVVGLFEEYVRRILPDCGLAKCKGFRRMDREEFLKLVETVRLNKRTAHLVHLISSPTPKMLAR